MIKISGYYKNNPSVKVTMNNEEFGQTENSFVVHCFDDKEPAVVIEDIEGKITNWFYFHGKFDRIE